MGIIYKDDCYKLNGAFFEVYKEKVNAGLFRYDSMVVELKAVRQVTDEHRAQVQHYLKTTGDRLGLWVSTSAMIQKWR